MTHKCKRLWMKKDTDTNTNRIYDQAMSVKHWMIMMIDQNKPTLC